MMNINQIRIGTLLRLYNIYKTKGDKYALVVDIDDDQVNPPMFKLLVEDEASWEYLRNVSWEIIK